MYRSSKINRMDKFRIEVETRKVTDFPSSKPPKTFLNIPRHMKQLAKVVVFVSERFNDSVSFQFQIYKSGDMTI